MDRKTIDMWSERAENHSEEKKDEQMRGGEHKGIYITDVRPGIVINGQFSVKIKKPVIEYRNGYRFELRVSDRTGFIDIKYWGGKNKERVEGIYSSFSVGDIVYVHGIAKEWNGNLEIDVNEREGQTIKPVPAGEYDISDFIESIDDKEGLLQELRDIADTVTDRNLSLLLDSFLSNNDFIAEFIDAPASVTHHSNLSGGLLHHTLKVVKIADSLCAQFPELDRDLVITGAILHDIGKVKEMKIGTNINPTEDGTLLGHIYIGASMVEKWIEAIPEFPDILKRKVIHIILSHHGRLEYGSPKVPMFPEAEAVHLADMSEALLEEMIKARRDANTEDPFIYLRGFGMDGINLYLR